MYLEKKDHVSRFVPYKKLLRDGDDKPIGILPQGFEMREKLDEKNLSVNWLEYFCKSHSENIVNSIEAFVGKTRDKRVGKNSAFCIANVGKLESVCVELMHDKVRVVHDEKAKVTTSHAKIVRLPINDPSMMQALASEVFTEIVCSKEVLDFD